MMELVSKLKRMEELESFAAAWKKREVSKTVAVGWDLFLATAVTLYYHNRTRMRVLISTMGSCGCLTVTTILQDHSQQSACDADNEIAKHAEEGKVITRPKSIGSACDCPMVTGEVQSHTDDDGREGSEGSECGSSDGSDGSCCSSGGGSDASGHGNGGGGSEGCDLIETIPPPQVNHWIVKCEGEELLITLCTSLDLGQRKVRME